MTPPMLGLLCKNYEIFAVNFSGGQGGLFQIQNGQEAPNFMLSPPHILLGNCFIVLYL